ncbi:hypothetical protein POTOM_030629 [Populus tomentosa]|uniref:Transcription factor CBF/NF-Y/archaeal histone domain-containing protein n=1 Tax=Populus tomentosa TaxID=118781 RepID=A0A8X7ZEV6_POPTO|nr:hypothetical protein POTOM_030629 [Populus tomentosa]
MVDNVGAGASGDDGGVQLEQDRLLPIANVGRIMKQILPPNAKISKEAKETMQECASEFISFVTGEASERCRKERRKTVNGDDVCWAMGALGFDDYAGPLRSIIFHELKETLAFVVVIKVDQYFDRIDFVLELGNVNIAATCLYSD